MHRLGFRFTKFGIPFIAIQSLHQAIDPNQGKAIKTKVDFGYESYRLADTKRLVKRRAELDKPTYYMNFCPMRPQAIGLMLTHKNHALLIKTQQEKGDKSWAPPMTIRQQDEEPAVAALRGFYDKMGPIINPSLLSGALEDPDHRLDVVYSVTVFQHRFKAIYVLEVPAWLWVEIDVVKFGDRHDKTALAVSKIDISNLIPTALEALPDDNILSLQKDVVLRTYSMYGEELNINIDQDFARMWLVHHLHPEFFD
jgi:ADP-ribose pyrophosphatase YjhB (NUDIX family)